MEVHFYYRVSRITYLSASSILLATYILQIYRHRNPHTTPRPASNNTGRNWRLKTHRVFRVLGMLGTLFFTIGQIDAYGVYGILPAGVSLSLFFLVILCCWTSLLVASYYAVVATLPFIGFDRKVFSRRFSVFLAAFGILLPGGIVVAFNTPAVAAFIVSLIIDFLGIAVIVAGVNYVYYRLRAHRKALRRSAAKIRRSDELDKIIHKWRNYTLILTIVLSIMAVVVMYALVIRIGSNRTDTNLRETFSVDDPLLAPSLGVIAVPLVYFAVLIIMLWRSSSWGSTATSRATAASRATASSTATTTSSGLRAAGHLSSPHPPTPSSRAASPTATGNGNEDRKNSFNVGGTSDGRKNSFNVGGTSGGRPSITSLSLHNASGARARMHSNTEGVSYPPLVTVTVDIGGSGHEENERYTLDARTPSPEHSRASHSHSTLTGFVTTKYLAAGADGASDPPVDSVSPPVAFGSGSEVFESVPLDFDRDRHRQISIASSPSRSVSTQYVQAAFST